MSDRLQQLRVQLVAGENAARIGARIEARRKEMGWTRRELAKRMEGLATEPDIYRWEKGRHRPRDDTLAAIAQALGQPFSYFVDPKADGTPALFPTDTTGRPGELAEVTERLREIEKALGQINEAVAMLLTLSQTTISGDLQEVLRRLAASTK